MIGVLVVRVNSTRIAAARRSNSSGRAHPTDSYRLWGAYNAGLSDVRASQETRKRSLCKGLLLMDGQLCGIAERVSEAVRVVEHLKSGGVPIANISVLSPMTASEYNDDCTALGEALGWRVGIGAFAIADLGRFVAVGPIMQALLEAEVEKAVGALGEALVHIGMTNKDANHCEAELRNGRSLVFVELIESDDYLNTRRLLETSGMSNCIWARATEPVECSKAERNGTPDDSIRLAYNCG